MSVKKYYNQINKFFDLIEKTFKKKIIVCGHPKRKLKGLYSRKMVFNRSVELTQNAAFCMAHNSYAVNFPIILKKPFILLSTNELEGTLIYQDMLALASLFNKKIINISNFKKKEIINSLRTSKKLYRNYIEGYIAEKNVNNNRWSFVESKLRIHLNDK